MPGYIEFFGLDEWYSGLLPSEQAALEKSIPGLLTETYESNLKGHPGIYSTLITNIDVPPGILERMKLNVCDLHIRAGLLEKNICNRTLLNPLRNGNHGFEDREFQFYKCMAAKALTTFYFWNRDLLGEEKIFTYAEMTINLYQDFITHSRFLHIQNLRSLVSRLEKYYEDAFVRRNKTPQSDPKLYEELTVNITKHKTTLYELENSSRFIKDNFFWNYSRFLAVRKRFDEASNVILRAIDLHTYYAGYYSVFLNQIRDNHNFGKRDVWVV